MGALVRLTSSFIPAAGGLYSMVDLSFIFIYSFPHSFTGFLEIEQALSCRRRRYGTVGRGVLGSVVPPV